MKEWLLVASALFLFSCQNNPGKEVLEANMNPTSSNESKIDPYWYNGQAEITSYQLEQNRYNDIHNGHVVLIQVTEDFLTEKQVKNDRYKETPSVPVLKSNLLSRFTTGMYDYSIMTSTFTAANGEESFKVSNSSQDWCGHSWSQLNRSKNGYDYQQRSYFEAEADAESKIQKVLLEDELFNLLRILKEDMVVGNLKVLPSMTYIRLKHIEPKGIEANASWSDSYNGNPIQEGQSVYTIEMKSQQRKIEILVDKGNLYAIEGWVDSYPSVFDNKIRSTLAKKKNRILSDYWTKNGKLDTKIRADLGLD